MLNLISLFLKRRAGELKGVFVRLRRECSLLKTSYL